MQYFKHEIKVGENAVELSCYLPDAAPRTYFPNNRPAMIVLPGGGYGMTYPGEGEPIALDYLARGFCAFVLHYSVYPARFPQALVEALLAIRFVRENAKEYGIDPAKISISGFSAGGHLAACTGTLWNHACLEEYLGSDREIYRPNAMVLAYPVINIASHKGSFLNLFSQREEELTAEIQNLLNKYGDDGKAPNPMAEGMSWIKTNVMLMMNESDHTVADLITDGCNMGVKSLNKYLNEYCAADEVSKDIAKRLISLEADLGENMRAYL